MWKKGGWGFLGGKAALKKTILLSNIGKNLWERNDVGALVMAIVSLRRRLEAPKELPKKVRGRRCSQEKKQTATRAKNNGVGGAKV